MKNSLNSPQTKTDNPLFKQMFNSAYKLSLFMFVCIVLLLTIYKLTAPQIAHEQREAMLNTFNKVLPPSLYNNTPLEDTLDITDEKSLALLGSKNPVTIYRARQNNQPAGVIFQVVARNGYSSHITLLMGVLPDGSVSGVRVLDHRETPGLGDKIEERKDDWILSFNGRTLHTNTTNQQVIANDPRWAVKKDGGEFDQFTGATITPRAVISAVKNALLFVHQRGESLYE
ncbi:MAG: electron transport complex subunit RsxG [Thiomicrorhabdus sp.]|nr:electron transport complex subunit RsxG [Thiomicrorhabdus sp.]